MNRLVLILLVAATLLLTAALVPAVAQEPANDYNLQNGENIYRTQCSSCHGPFGEGLSAPALDDSGPMQTYRNFDELASVVSETMPPSQPGLVTGKDAEDLTAYLVENLDNPVSLPASGTGSTDGEADETGTTGDTAGSEENGAPGFSGIIAASALVAATLLARRR